MCDGARRLIPGTLPEPEAVALLRTVTAGHRPRGDPAQLAELARVWAKLSLSLSLHIAVERAAGLPHRGLDELISDLRYESALWVAPSVETTRTPTPSALRQLDCHGVTPERLRVIAPSAPSAAKPAEPAAASPPGPPTSSTSPPAASNAAFTPSATARPTSVSSPPNSPPATIHALGTWPRDDPEQADAPG
ncbi:hypothetical protein [Kitasatospora sp. NPDC087271]|uniref:hypothetical protein n=1 Tax=Kitasatospora sp. NPDC087271 TaxID=3364067 RepID=UPI0037F79924